MRIPHWLRRKVVALTKRWEDEPVGFQPDAVFLDGAPIELYERYGFAEWRDGSRAEWDA